MHESCITRYMVKERVSQTPQFVPKSLRVLPLHLPWFFFFFRKFNNSRVNAEIQAKDMSPQVEVLSTLQVQLFHQHRRDPPSLLGKKSHDSKTTSWDSWHRNVHQMLHIGPTIICGRNKKTLLLRTGDESSDIWCRKATQVTVSWHIHILPYFYHGTSGAHGRRLNSWDGQQNKWRPCKEWPGMLTFNDCRTHVSCLSSWYQVSALHPKLFYSYSCATKTIRNEVYS